jgi:UDP-N-acetylmuramyl pentapeptide phosphotransferase/UDP-N-acetylglucosamine-1-phosphate transferase
VIAAFGFGFAVALLMTLCVVQFAGSRSRDTDLSGPQKFHARPVPRIGGLAIYVGFLAGAGAWVAGGGEGLQLTLSVLICSLPAFAAGLAEDLTKRVTPQTRMLAILGAAALAVWLLDAEITRTSIPGLDWIAGFSMGSAALALFVVAGVANSINIIDGFNGLASMCSMIMLIGVAFVAYLVGDLWIVGCALLTVAATMGFFFWNYPRGLVFLGDGGAYFLGFMLAELCIMLIGRHARVSPLFPLVLCAYPVVETVFTMYRRKVLRGRPVGLPDGVHLHSLVYRRLLRLAVSGRAHQDLTRRNSLTAPYLWVICSLSTLPAVAFWDNTAYLAGLLLAYVCGYVFIYLQIVRFRTPRWLVLRR